MKTDARKLPLAGRRPSKSDKARRLLAKQTRKQQAQLDTTALAIVAALSDAARVVTAGQAAGAIPSPDGDAMTRQIARAIAHVNIAMHLSGTLRLDAAGVRLNRAYEMAKAVVLRVAPLVAAAPTSTRRLRDQIAGQLKEIEGMDMTEYVAAFEQDAKEEEEEAAAP